MLTLAALLAPHVAAPPGPTAGTCYLCGAATPHGYREPPSDNFTAWAACYGGDVLCPVCRALLHDRRFRARSWCATPAGVRFATPEDRGWLWAALLDPPAPPFALYCTRGGQKQGWLSLARYVSHSREQFWVGTDWTDRPVRCARGWLAATAEQVTALRARGVSKATLLSGQPTAAQYARALREGWAAALDAARRWAGDPRWELLVYASA